MFKVIVAGIGTDVGKTVVAGILAEALTAGYWKPVETGSSDTEMIEQLIDRPVFPPAYRFTAPVSPHHAALLENREIKQFYLPTGPLVIESVGGILVPLTYNLTSLDLFAKWPAQWVVVSRHYLGSINHTLMTIEVLKQRGVDLRGIIFNGLEYPEGEQAILKLSGCELIGRLNPEPIINVDTIKRYANRWKNTLGTLTDKCFKPKISSR